MSGETHSLLLDWGETMELIEKIRSIITPTLDEHQVYLDDIQFVEENNEWYLRIFVEKIKGTLDMDTCVAVSESISQRLDEEDPITNEYYLEVSSPGIERPLRSWQEVANAIDEYVYVEWTDTAGNEKNIEGYIRKIEEPNITIQYFLKGVKKSICLPYNTITFIRYAVKF